MSEMQNTWSNSLPGGGGSASRTVRCWRSCYHLLMVVLLCGAQAIAPAAQAGQASSPPLFQSTDTLEAVLRLPWQQIVTDEFFYQGGYPSELSYTNRQGNKVSLALETERRGKSRQVICRYPPIKLRFRKDTAQGTVFEGQKSLKLITHCDKGKAFEQYQVLEALAYRMYNLITDRSFRVRPLSLTYLDSDSGKADGPRFAFLLEDDDALSKRNGLKKLKIPTLDPQRMDAAEASRLALFQYMIGNTAWSLEAEAAGGNCCNNLELLGTDEETGPVYAAPNDFDSSGLVNAPYAKSAGGVQAASVRERKFLGFCVHNETLDQARQMYRQKAEAIRALVEQEAALESDSRDGALAYLEPFFEMLNDTAQFDAVITANCKR